jgi:pyruvate kinase
LPSQHEKTHGHTANFRHFNKSGQYIDLVHEMMHQVDEILIGKGIAKVGDEVVVVAGTPPGIPGSTNSLRVHRVGDAINGAAPAYAR